MKYCKFYKIITKYIIKMFPQPRKAHIYFLILLAFFLYGLSLIGMVSFETIMNLQVAAFALITIATIITLYYAWVMRNGPKFHKKLIMMFVMLALFCYAYTVWCHTCKGSLIDTIFTGPLTDPENLLKASFAFITMALGVCVYKTIVK